MGDIINFYTGKKKDLSLIKEIEDTRTGLSFAIEEEDEETLIIDEAKLKAELANIKAHNPNASIAIILDEPEQICPAHALEAVRQLEDESHMIEFEEEEE